MCNLSGLRDAIAMSDLVMFTALTVITRMP